MLLVVPARFFTKEPEFGSRPGSRRGNFGEHTCPKCKNILVGQELKKQHQTIFWWIQTLSSPTLVQKPGLQRGGKHSHHWLHHNNNGDCSDVSGRLWPLNYLGLQSEPRGSLHIFAQHREDRRTMSCMFDWSTWCFDKFLWWHPFQSKPSFDIAETCWNTLQLIDG